MRFAIGVLALSACNSVFGLQATQGPPNADAAYFDAPVDAPYACPPAGETPEFSRLLHQVDQDCQEFASSTTGRATALCQPISSVLQLAEGPIDGPFVPIPELEQIAPDHYDLARYTPEGDELFVRHWQQNTTVGRFRAFRRQGESFVPAYDIAIDGRTFDSFARFGSPSFGPRRRMMIADTLGVFEEIELDATGAATVVASYTAADLGIEAITGIPPNLTPDGLHMIFAGNDGSARTTMYSNRASLAERWTAARSLPTVPDYPVPFMTSDCSRIYLSGLGNVFWVQRN